MTTKTKTRMSVIGAFLLVAACGGSSSKAPATANTTPEQPSGAMAQGETGQTPPPTVSSGDATSASPAPSGTAGMDPANPGTESKTAAPVTGEPEVTMAKNDDAAAKQAAGTPPAAPAAGGDAAGANRAEADIKMLGNEGAAVGTLTFEQDGNKVTMKGTFSGLTPGKHGFHIHEKGDCGGKDAKNAGGHFNPTKAKHGPPESAKRHLGDFGNITADKDGNATFEMTTDSITVTPGVDSVVNHAVIIHKGEDNGKTQPSGGSGPPIACGVIEAK